MELADLVNAIQVVELGVRTRAAAIRGLVQAANWDDEGLSPDAVIEALEEREATCQTVIADGLALPHAVVPWPGEYRILLGRSREGIEYGIAGSPPVRLILLLMIGKGREQNYVDLLSAIAELMLADDFRAAVANASDTREIERLLLARVGLEVDGDTPRPPRIPRLTTILIRQAMQLVELVDAQALLLAVNRPDSVPWELVNGWKGRLLVITSEHDEDFEIERPDTHRFEIPHASLSRMDRVNLGLLLAASTGVLHERSSVVCVSGNSSSRLDCINVSRPSVHLKAMFAGKSSRRTSSIRPAVILRVLSLAIELSNEGREAKPVGAMFVIGDTAAVMKHARQLVLNPFHGFARQLRNLLDPSLAETIKEFALIDGAFIVQGDGTVLSSGTYLLPKSLPSGLPSGLGTRHQTAAAITAHTRALAVTVSQSTGTVTVFRNGQIVFTLERASPTRW